MRLLAIIPARKGSKRLPGKNMRMLGGKSLVEHAIDAAGDFDCVVTSDSMETLELAALYGAVGVFRPAHLASDDASMSGVVAHVLSLFPLHDAFVLLQPTSPLRTARDVRTAVKRFEENGETSLISVAEGTRYPNGAIYIGRRERFLENGLFCDDRTFYWPMPAEKSVDIDTIDDFEKAEDYLLGPRVVYADGHVGRRAA